VNDTELVKVRHAGCYLEQLKVRREQKKHRVGGKQLASCNRFTSGLDLAYSVTFPLVIHRVRMRKQHGSMETETPNKGRMLGWESYFHPMISRHNRLEKLSSSSGEYHGAEVP
jgi:hypothetical protein